MHGWWGDGRQRHRDTEFFSWKSDPSYFDPSYLFIIRSFDSPPPQTVWELPFRFPFVLSSWATRRICKQKADVCRCFICPAWQNDKWPEVLGHSLPRLSGNPLSTTVKKKPNHKQQNKKLLNQSKTPHSLNKSVIPTISLPETITFSNNIPYIC